MLIKKEDAKILLIDDNPKNLQVAMNILNKEGYHLIYAKDGEKAMELAHKDDFDLILLDIVMPGIDGFTVCTNFKSNPKTKHIPIIFLTVKDHEQDIIKGFECGAVDYVIKPFQIAVLLKRVETHLTLSHRTKKLATLNDALHQQVNDQVEKIRLQDQILFQQSKMASMGEMIANIAHQWRQPLAAISTAIVGIKSKLFLKTFDLESKEGQELCQSYLSRKFDDIEEYIQNLSTTIDDFRYFFKPQKEVEEFDLSALIDKNIKLLGEDLKENHIQIINEIGTVKIVGLKNELSQVIINLLKNAKDALVTQKEDVKKIILIQATQEDNMINIYVKDSAKGIPEKILPKIFEPYFTTKHQSNGTGLGLYMVNEIIQKHMKGTIDVTNISFDYGNMTFKGAQFHIRLPKGAL